MKQEAPVNDFAADLEQCLEVLHGGGVILYPTDTIWGLGCDATNSNAVKQLIAIKQKPAQKGLIILLASERDLLRYVAAPDPEIFTYLETVSSPVTVVYEHGLSVADEVLNEDGSLAIRLVTEDFCRHLLKRFKKPIVSTSANVHGQPSPQIFNDISERLKSEVGYVVKFRQAEKTMANASSIIRWDRGKITDLRKNTK